MACLGHESSGVGQCGHLYPIWVRSRSILPPFNVQPFGQVAERMFFLRNDTNVSLPMFTGNHPIPQSNWGYDIA
jgi:hypothetical protein